MIVEAWGENDFVAPGGGGADASGFEADEGFDSFLAMQAPPEVSIIIFEIHLMIFD